MRRSVIVEEVGAKPRTCSQLSGCLVGWSWALPGQQKSQQRSAGGRETSALFASEPGLGGNQDVAQALGLGLGSHKLELGWTQLVLLAARHRGQDAIWRGESTTGQI